MNLAGGGKKSGKSGVAPQVLEEILAVAGHGAIRGQRGFLLHGGEHRKTVLELFAGTSRLSSAFAKHFAAGRININVEAFEVLRGGPAEDLLDKAWAW